MVKLIHNGAWTRAGRTAVEGATITVLNVGNNPHMYRREFDSPRDFHGCRGINSRRGFVGHRKFDRGFDSCREFDLRREFDSPREFDGCSGLDSPREFDRRRGFDSCREVDLRRGFDSPRDFHGYRVIDSCREFVGHRELEGHQELEGGELEELETHHRCHHGCRHCYNPDKAGSTEQRERGRQERVR